MVDFDYTFILFQEAYTIVESDAQKVLANASTVIKVERSGEEFRQARKEKEETLDTSEAILTGDQKEELDQFLEDTDKVRMFIKFYGNVF